MKKAITFLAACFVFAFAVAAEDAPTPPPMVPALKLSGHFQTKAIVAKSTNGAAAVTDKDFLAVGGFSADYKGTGINFTTVSLLPSIPGLDVMGGYPNLDGAYDFHATLFDGMSYTAIGKLLNTEFITVGPISQQTEVTDKIGKNTTGLMEKVSPINGLSIAAFYPVYDNLADASYTTQDAFKAMSLTAGYALPGLVKINGGWSGNSKDVFFNVGLDPQLIKGLSAVAAFNYKYDNTMKAATVGLNAGFTNGMFAVTSENWISFPKGLSATYAFRLRGELVNLPVVKSRLDLGYGAVENFQGNPDNLFEIYPQILLNTEIIPFADVNVGFKYQKDMDNNANSNWSIPISVEILVL